jgi:hypothetical protein
VAAVTKTCVAAAGVYCGLGLEVPVAPTIVAMFAVVLVRVLVWTPARSIPWNVAVCLLAMLAAFASVEGSQLSVFRAFWLGVGYGALGVGIIEIGKSAVGTALRDGLRTVAKGVLGTKDATP